MNIQFVNPNFHSGGPEIIVGTVPPLGLLSVAGALKSEGYKNLSLLDLAKEKNTEDLIRERFENNNIDMVFIGGMAATASLNKSLESVSLIKEINKDINIVLGGTHSTYV